MSNRSNFVKIELEKIYNNLNISYENAQNFRIENDSRFIKIFKLLMEISKKSNDLANIIKGNYLFI